MLPYRQSAPVLSYTLERAGFRTRALVRGWSPGSSACLVSDVCAARRGRAESIAYRAAFQLLSRLCAERRPVSDRIRPGISVAVAAVFKPHRRPIEKRRNHFCSGESLFCESRLDCVGAKACGIAPLRGTAANGVR